MPAQSHAFRVASLTPMELIADIDLDEVDCLGGLDPFESAEQLEEYGCAEFASIARRSADLHHY